MITQAGRTKAGTPGKEFSVTASQVVLPANTNRVGAFVVALSTNSKRARYAFGTQAFTNSPPLDAGGSLPIDSSYLGPVSVCADDLTTAIFVYVVEW